MNRVVLHGFVDELLKIAYGEAEHTQLMQSSGKTMGASPQLSAIGTKGSLATDAGMRHPWIPTNAPLHAMPSQSRMQILRGVAKTRKKAVQDLAASAAGHTPLAGIRASRGMMDLGQAQHTYMDLGAHFEKPIEEGISGAGAKTLKGRAAGAIRRIAPKVPGAGSLGFAVSGLEHAGAGLKQEGKGVGSHLDVLDPSKYKADVSSMTRAERFGASSRRAVIRELRKKHGYSPNQAGQLYEHLMTNVRPGRAATAVGGVQRNLRYLREQAGRPGQLFRSLKGVARKAVSFAA